MVGVYQESDRPKEAAPHLNRAEEIIESVPEVGPEAQSRAKPLSASVQFQEDVLSFRGENVVSGGIVESEPVGQFER